MDVSPVLIVIIAFLAGLALYIVVLAYGRDEFSSLRVNQLSLMSVDRERDVAPFYVVEALSRGSESKVLTLDGSINQDAANLPPIPLGKTLVKVSLVATSASDHAAWTAQFAVYRTSSTVTFSSPINFVVADGNTLDWTATSVAATTDRTGMKITVVGEAATQVQWSAKLEYVTAKLAA